MDKKEKILHTALKLFARDGFNATSTNKIAKAAEVSEGLIFSHYKSKNGLLNAIMELAIVNMGKAVGPILALADPVEVIRESIELPFSIPASEYDFWRLQYKLKWDTNYDHKDKLKPITDKIEWALTTLNVEDAALEAKFLVDFGDTIMVNILRQGKESQLPYRQFLFKKFNID